MAPRDESIGQSIAHSVLRGDTKRPSILGRVPAFFYPYWLRFDCVRGDLFKALRGVWQINEDDYRASFGADKKAKAKSKSSALEPLGDMGFSGSTFFHTSDSAYLVKSVPRHFENSFFKNDLLLPYAEYMPNNVSSLLVRITDFLEYRQYTIGSLLGLAPGYHIVMENLKFGEDLDKRSKDEAKWETYDLKPLSYFYPERDVAGGALSSEAAKSKLADDFDDKLVLTLDQAEDFKAQLQKDTALLAKCNAVDYSLFLVRIPAAGLDGEVSKQPFTPKGPPLGSPAPPSWRTGVASQDGQWIYRASILDFFWSKHKIQAKAMTGLIQTYNLVDQQGHMSITTTSDEYRERFLKMCEEMVDIK